MAKEFSGSMGLNLYITRDFLTMLDIDAHDGERFSSRGKFVASKSYGIALAD